MKKETFIVPKNTSKIEAIYGEEGEKILTVSSSIWSYFFPIDRFFVSKKENPDDYIFSTCSYDSLNIWLCDHLYEKISEDSILESGKSIEIIRKPRLIFYGLDGKKLGEVKYSSNDILKKAIKSLENTEFFHFSSEIL